jgi:hypothetical protein
MYLIGTQYYFKIITEGENLQRQEANAKSFLCQLK